MDRERERQASGEQLLDTTFFDERLVLASSSPRRAEILRAVEWPFEISAVDIDETQRALESPTAYVERLAREKAEAAAHRFSGRLVLGADTIVLIDEKVLGKPRDMEDARRMLRELSGRWHEVLTGVALVREGERRQRTVAHERTRVHFNAMSEAEINWHAENGRPLDKAGAYAVQGHAALFIREIQGDYWNVVGLPVQLVYKMARELTSDSLR
jgi:septum formation protein